MATLENFKSETQLLTDATNIVTTNNKETRFIGKATVTNTSDSNVVVTVWRILTATTATEGSGGNWIIRVTVPAGKSLILRDIMQHVLGNSMAIKAKASVAGVVNIDVSGTTET